MENSSILKENSLKESKSRIKVDPEWFRWLDRTLCRTLDPKFQAHQCFIYKYADQKGSVAMLAINLPWL